MENKLSGHIKSFSIPIMFVQSHYGSFCRIFEEFYNFAVIIDSFQMSFVAPYILNTPCKIEKLYKKTFLLMTYVQKTSCFEVACPGHTIAYKNVDNLLKNGKNIF